jgi:hypothetical protein
MTGVPGEETAPEAVSGEGAVWWEPDPRTGAPADPRELVSRTVRLLVTLTDAAQFFGVNYWRLRKAVTRGELPARKFGPAPTSPHFVRIADVGHYLAYSKGGGRRRGPRPAPPTVQPHELVVGAGVPGQFRPGAPPSPGRIAAARAHPRDGAGRFVRAAPGG